MRLTLSPYSAPAELQSMTVYTVFRKKTPTHSFFHISMNDVSI